MEKFRNNDIIDEHVERIWGSIALLLEVDGLQLWFKKDSREDRNGFSAEICEKYRDYLIGTAMKLTQDRFYAEDVVQETIRKLIETSRSLKDMSELELKKYMRQATIHNAFTYMKKIWQEIPVEKIPNEMVEDVVWQAILEADTKEQLLDCVARLTPRQRTVLALAYYEDWDTKQIAESLGISLDGVRMLKKRGLESMRELLGEEGCER